MKPILTSDLPPDPSANMMSSSSLQSLERELGIALPGFYRQALLESAFPDDSLATEMLVTDASWLLERNRAASLSRPARRRNRRSMPGIVGGYFLIGSDGGESQYFLSLSHPAGEVSEYLLETGELKPFAPDFASYLARVQSIDAEIELEELEGEKRAAQIPKWRHDLRYYTPLIIGILLVFVVVPLVVMGLTAIVRALFR